jgi:hypothetical protein
MDRWEKAWRKLLADLWEGERSDGSWDGGDLVVTVDQALQALGLDTKHPADRPGGAGEVHLYDPAELRHIAAGGAPWPRCSDCREDGMELDAAGRCEECAAEAVAQVSAEPGT